MATDASAEQIGHAHGPSNVEFRVARADASGLPDGSADCVTVAQALHWFAEKPFFEEVRRVTVPGGLVAAWSYGSCHAGADIEETLREFQDGTMGPYWFPERHWVDEGYRTIPFPFDDLPARPFELRMEWTLRQLGAYLSSWSAVANYKRERGDDPVPPLLERIAERWTDYDQPRAVTWPLHLRIGRVG